MKQFYNIGNAVNLVIFLVGLGIGISFLMKEMNDFRAEIRSLSTQNTELAELIRQIDPGSLTTELNSRLDAISEVMSDAASGTQLRAEIASLQGQIRELNLSPGDDSQTAPSPIQPGQLTSVTSGVINAVPQTAFFVERAQTLVTLNQIEASYVVIVNDGSTQRMGLGDTHRVGANAVCTLALTALEDGRSATFLLRCS